MKQYIISGHETGEISVWHNITNWINSNVKLYIYIYNMVYIVLHGIFIIMLYIYIF